VARQEVEHARAGDHIDSRQRAQHGRHPAFHLDLSVNHASVSCNEIGMGWQAEVLSNLRASEIEHRRFDGAHRSFPRAHSEDSRGSSPDDRRPGLRELMDRDATDALGCVLNH
jgi:hypothetical protein